MLARGTPRNVYADRGIHALAGTRVRLLYESTMHTVYERTHVCVLALTSVHAYCILLASIHTLSYYLYMYAYMMCLQIL